MSSGDPPPNLPGNSTHLHNSMADVNRTDASEPAATRPDTSIPPPSMPQPNMPPSNMPQANAPPPGLSQSNVPSPSRPVSSIHLPSMPPPSVPPPGTPPPGMPQSSMLRPGGSFQTTPLPTMLPPIAPLSTIPLSSMPPPGRPLSSMPPPAMPQSSMPPPSRPLSSMPPPRIPLPKQPNIAKDPPVLPPPRINLPKMASDMTLHPPLLLRPSKAPPRMPPTSFPQDYIAPLGLSEPLHNPTRQPSQPSHRESHSQKTTSELFGRAPAHQPNPGAVPYDESLPKATFRNEPKPSVPEVLFTGGMVANKMPPFRDPFPPPLQRDAQHVGCMAPRLRPPAPPALEKKFAKRKTLANLKSFWEHFFTWVLVDSWSEYKLTWEEGNIEIERHQISIGPLFPNGRNMARVMVGLVCEPDDEDAAEIAAREAWPAEWNGKQIPGQQCYFFVASERFVFYVYSKIDGTYRAWEEGKAQVSCHLSQSTRVEARDLQSLQALHNFNGIFCPKSLRTYLQQPRLSVVLHLALKCLC